MMMADEAGLIDLLNMACNQQPESLYLTSLEEFNAAILATKNGGKPLVVDFTASWCPPCNQIGPLFEAQVKKQPGLVLRKVDVDANAGAKQAAGITAMPTFKVYKDGAEVNAMKGADEPGLIDLLNMVSSN